MPVPKFRKLNDYYFQIKEVWFAALHLFIRLNKLLSRIIEYEFCLHS